ncbi:BQ5605_C016g08274 [Microbotryum silenes-dioicae]|uniref:Glucosidase 2 subunit beta n=1 Tax=Microbotryum silenes-dioicae TaxID=796604 RepID=A0A2X0LZQ6_9BASI|nr:BQ5605_C016g08274 [Microbotryum silenes-dioicae]
MARTRPTARTEPSSTWSRRLSVLLLVWAAITSVDLVIAVKKQDFKTCEQSGFCNRNRQLADRAIDASSTWKSPYSIASPPRFEAGRYIASVKNALFPLIGFRLEIRFQNDGLARVIVDEVDGLRQRYNETASWALVQEPVLDLDDAHYSVEIDAKQSTISYGPPQHDQQVQVQHDPLLITFLRDGQPHILLNERGLFNMEHFRVKPIAGQDQGEVVIQDPDHPTEQTVIVPDKAYPGFLPTSDDGMWEESFNGKQDSKPKGPESLSLDINFLGYEHVYGIPQHASTLSLKQTRGGTNAYTDPYRLYNLDVFEYDADSEMAIYGSIPFMKAHRAGSTVAVFAAIGSEMWIDITKSSTPKRITSAFKKRSKDGASTDAGPSPVTTSTHWIAESGILDLFVFLGPSSLDIFDQYTTLTGKIPMPQYFATAYHQCRWNYVNEEDVQEVQTKFDEFDIPMDVMWLDIEYAEEHKYFIWNKDYFPTPEKMQQKLVDRGRQYLQLVAIVDPHIKRTSSLHVYKEAQDLDVLCKDRDGNEFRGWCWTGDSAWVDFFHPKSWDWWVSLFRFDKFVGSTKNLYIWNDMNEPSVFDGPEITMHKDAIHYGGWEHRDVHNINGMLYQNITARGLLEREPVPRRPFVLTRAFFAGSQRFGAMWTGDNLGRWSHLQSTLPMLLTNGIAGMTFAGSDTGGFFGDPSEEMMTRWYQVGALSPFFRAHGHLDTKRREPYLFAEPYRSMMRESIRLRYKILPAMYTAFYEASRTGIPILRPQYVVFPNDPKGFDMEDQFYLGSTGLLAKPVVHEGVTQAEVYISDDQPYYHYFNHDLYFGVASGGTTIKVAAPLDSTPLFHRGGSIFPRRDLVRRSSILMWKDPITLVVAVDLTGTQAEGSLYLDDGESFDHEKGDFVHRGFQLAPASPDSKSLVLSSRSLVDPSAVGLQKYDATSNAWAKKIEDVVVREIRVLGLASKPTCVRLAGTQQGLEFDWIDGLAASNARRRSGRRSTELVIKDAGALVVQDWDITLDFGGNACPTVPVIDHEARLQSPECAPGQFYCQNQGFTPNCILRSRVNDGICDPECCDGSDETDGKAKCGNFCAELARENARIMAEKKRKQRVGAAIRRDYIKFGVKEKGRLQDEIEKGQKELERLTAKQQSSQATLERLENEAAGDIQRKKESLLYEKIVEMQHAIEALQKHRQKFEGHIVELSGVLADLSRDFNPNYQDMAVLGATRAFKEWQTTNNLLDENGKPYQIEGEILQVPVANDIDDMTDDQLNALRNEDPLNLIDSLSTRVGERVVPSSSSTIFNIGEYIPDKFKPRYDAFKKSLMDVLVGTGIIYPSASTEGAETAELTSARAAVSALVDEKGRLEERISSAQGDLNRDYGRDWEWKKLAETCLEKDHGGRVMLRAFDHSYKVCFLDKAEQIQHGVPTSLGTFSGWSPTATVGTDEYYLEQSYSEGARCWNGPVRSSRVLLTCGTKNELVSVTEPDKCLYLFKINTPAVCFEEATNLSNEKDEL